MANHDNWRQRIGEVIQLLASMMYADWTLALPKSAKRENLNIFYLSSLNTRDKKMTFTYFYRIDPRLLPIYVFPAYIV
jgi:hypothetical protein